MTITRFVTAASRYHLPRQYYLGVMDTPSYFAGNDGSVDVCSDGEGCGAPDNEGARVSDEISEEPCELLESEARNGASTIVSVPVSVEVQEAFLQNLCDNLSGCSFLPCGWCFVGSLDFVFPLVVVSC